ncbi:MAG: hypothetical protein HFI33_06105 [Lachnospiraceae bacterium]|nr:hypothetical protein [Lachnospiraceae bacterium]
MQRLKSILFVIGIMLFILAVTLIYVSITRLRAVLPADSYEDKGIFTFQPYQVLPVQVENTGASGRNRRMNPTRTVYMVYYRDTAGKGYQWQDQAVSRDVGQQVVNAGAPVERRVLGISAKGTYITIEAEQTAESYTVGLRNGYMGILGLSGAYILLYLLVWGILWIRKRSM